MRFLDTALQGALIIEPDAQSDGHGEVTWALYERALRERGLEWRLTQTDVSEALSRHTLRGLHCRVGGVTGAKLVRCHQGQMLNVIVDLRSGSPTFGQHEKVVLNADGGRMLYIPSGFADGFLTLEDDTKAEHRVSRHYSTIAERGLRWNDPRLAIAWPTRSPTLNGRDRAWPALASAMVVAEARQ